jgi:hypothetical protein
MGMSGGISKGLALSLLAQKAPALLKYKTVKVGDDVAAMLSAGNLKLEFVPQAAYTLDNISLPLGTRLVGNGAIVSPSSTANSVFNIFNHDVQVQDFDLLGQASDPNNSAYVKTHFAINIARAFRARVLNNRMRNFRGGCIGMVGSASDDYKEYGALIQGNEYNTSYFGEIHTGRYEFGRSIGNRGNNLRVGIWDEAGNWTCADNKMTSCRSPYIGTNRAVDYTANSIDAFVANSGHGTLTSFECNHSNDEGNGRWGTTGTAIPLIGGLTYTPTKNDGTTEAKGVHFDGLLPHTMAGLTLYYCDLQIKNRPTMARPTRISAIVASTCEIRADVAGVLELDGYTDHTGVTLVNAAVTDDRIASATVLGQIKVGSGLSVAADGTLSATASGGSRSTINISPSITEYGFNSQLGDGLPTSQGWSQTGNNTAVTDPAAANFAGFAIGTDGSVQTLIAKDSSSSHNPSFGITLSSAQKRSLYTNGGTVKLKWKPYSISAGSTGLLGISFAAESGWTGWTGTNTINQLYINPQLSSISGNLATVNWSWNGTAINQTNVDCSIYHDVEIRMFPAQNKCQLWVDGVQQGADQTWGTSSGVTGAAFAEKLFWASGSTSGSTIGIWIRKLSAFINGDLGALTTPASDADSTFAIPSDWRDYTLTIADQAYSKFATIKGVVSLPTGQKLTIQRANSNVLINDGSANVVISGNGTKQTVSLTQQVGATGKQWVVD